MEIAKNIPKTAFKIVVIIAKTSSPLAVDSSVFLI